MRIAFIGFGEAARAFTDSLAATGSDLQFAAYDILFDSEGTGGATAWAARERGVAVADTAAAAADGADWVIAAVTAASSLDAAASVASRLTAGQTFIDINSVSPGRKRDTAALFAPGVAYLDMAVMAPVHPAGHRTPVFLAGEMAADLRAALDRLDFRYEVVGAAAGEATAIKMVRSLFVKGLEAITVEALLAAEASGCFDRVFASLSGSFQGLGWPDFAAYQIERMLRHGTRRAAEMRESGVAMDEIGVGGDLARAIAAFHERLGALGVKPAAGEDPQATLRGLARRLDLSS